MRKKGKLVFSGLAVVLFSFFPFEAISSDWGDLRVAVLPFDDQRPSIDRSQTIRKNSGNPLFRFYTDDEQLLKGANHPSGQVSTVSDMVSQKIVEAIDSMGLFSQVRFVPKDNFMESAEDRRLMLKDEFDLILTGHLVRLYGLSHLVLPKDYYTVFGGSVEYPRDQRIAALAILEKLRLGYLTESAIIWKGDISGEVERSGQGTIAREAAMEGLKAAIEQLQDGLLKVHEAN